MEPATATAGVGRLTPPARGRLVALEGGEAVGKSTQAARLAERLGAVLTREPGATAPGRAIRGLVLDPSSGPLDPRAEALLLAADRAQHVAEVVEPALAGGQHVVTDRFVESSLAYQGSGRGLDLAEVRRLSAFATGGLVADVVVVLDLPVGAARARRSRQPDRMEAEAVAFHERVRAGFAALAAAEPDRIAVVDAAGSVDEVAARVWAEVEPRLG